MSCTFCLESDDTVDDDGHHLDNGKASSTNHKDGDQEKSRKSREFLKRVSLLFEYKVVCFILN